MWKSPVMFRRHYGGGLKAVWLTELMLPVPVRFRDKVFGPLPLCVVSVPWALTPKGTEVREQQRSCPALAWPQEAFSDKMYLVVEEAFDTHGAAVHAVPHVISAAEHRAKKASAR